MIDAPGPTVLTSAHVAARRISPEAKIAIECRSWPLRSWPAPGTMAERTAAFAEGEAGRNATLLSSEGVERLFQTTMDTAKDRRIPQGVPASFGFPQGHHEIKEIFRLVGFERHHPLLIVEAKRVGRIELHGGEPVPHFDMLIHHALPGRFRQQEPLPGLQEGTDNTII